MYVPGENDVIGSDEAYRPGESQTDRVNGEYHYKNGYTQKIYSDAHYVREEDSTSPPRYYTPPERPQKEPKEPKPRREKSRGGSFARTLCLCLICAVLGGLGGGTYVASRLSQRLDALQQGVKTAQTAALAGASADKTFFVQFNPSSLQMYSTNSPEQRRSLSSTNDDQDTVNDVVSAPRVELTTTLIFDKMNIYDAFMFDKFNTGVSATTVTNIVTLAKGATFTVQPYVEGLISALRNPYTQSMTFQWADFSFTGRLRQLQANYKMFSVSGRPIRAEVQLRLRQDLDTQDMQRWKSQFNSMLAQKSSLVTAGQKVSNLLNLSL